MNTDDLALGYVLGTLEPDDLSRVASLRDDPAFAAAVERARADVGDIGRGIDLVARGASQPPARARRGATWTRWASAAAAVALLAAGVAVLASRSDAPPSQVLDPGPVVPSQAGRVLGACELSTLAGKDAVAIVTGTVTDVRDGTADEDGSGGIDFQIATVAVSETIKGDAGATVHAFDYTYGAPWVSNGQELLLFLASSADTVHERIEPEHLQVLSGDCGSVVLQDGQPAGVGYTMEDVRAEVAG